jgi:hypothetical protein
MADESGRLLPRRSLLVGLGGLAAAGAIAAPGVGTSIVNAVSADGNDAGAGNVPLAHADAAEWRRHVGSTFLVRSESGPIYMELAAVKTFPSRGDRPDELKRQTAFSTHFVSKGAQAAAGNLIYRVMHPEKGELDIYFSAAGEGMLAVFN